MRRQVTKKESKPIVETDNIANEKLTERIDELEKQVKDLQDKVERI